MDDDAAQMDVHPHDAIKNPLEASDASQTAPGESADMASDKARLSPAPEQVVEVPEVSLTVASDAPPLTEPAVLNGLPSIMDDVDAPAPSSLRESQPESVLMIVEESTVPEPSQQRSFRPSPVDPQNYTLPDRPLNVTDALSYLDAVKMQFHDQPDVYNHFLDIMKEFKNEMIDTPGVIKRVSHLFHGHPTLIQGFNTFLPVGYRIECGTDAEDANLITVTTPSGTTTQTTNINQRPVSPDPRMYVSDEQAMEPAVQYVQKIKQRCDPETYQQFLYILSQYHHKPGTMDEEEVSRQISRLFKDAPDLRSDFRVFMPERSQQLLDDDYTSTIPRTVTPPTESRNRRRLETVVSVPSSSNLAPPKRKRKDKEKEKDIVSKATPVTKKLKPSGQEALSSYSARSVAIPLSPRRSQFQISQFASTAMQSRQPIESEDMQFFDRVKRALDNRDTYNEFLKLINLFTQGYIDTARLVKESRNFLGDTELLRQFREILDWDDKKEREHYMQDLEQNWTRPVISNARDRPGRVDMSVQFGSYRKLPPHEANVTCSGRDEMCRSVLNDEWVSHPTWSSEDSGFIAHKKNIYEEALHRSEEERHEYDFHIEAITRTIAMLEPISNKIAQLGPEDRTNFKLKPNLGGVLKSIHQRIIKKIYGREAGLEVVQAMQDTPVLAIPVVLQRLKQKEEEWKRAQREWNKVWREADARNYLKSLDHQAITFKSTDKRNMATKAFVSQIEAAKEEQMAKRASLIDPLFARTRPRHQLECTIDDIGVLQDSLKLTFSFLDRTQAQINFTERKRIEGFLRIFVPLFFMLDAVVFNSTFAVVQENVDSEMSGEDLPEDVEVSSTGSAGSRRGRKGSSNTNGGISAFGGGDLRKKLLKSEQAKLSSRKTRTQEAASPSASRFASPAPENNDTSQTGFNVHTRRYPRRNNFFTNTTFYVLLRQLEILYSRLRFFKILSAKKAKHSDNVANGMLTTDTKIIQNPDAEQLYELLLETCERLFDNEIEQNAFEDQMRRIFGIHDTYKVFTIDKLIGAIIKQVQTIFSDSKSQELLDILKKDRALISPTTQDHLNSRRGAEKVLGPDENLFRIDWTPETKVMTVQLLGKDDSSFDDSEALTGRWQSYIDSYVSCEITDGITQNRIRRPFLRKNLPADIQKVEPLVVTKPGIEIKLCVRTYRLFYVTGSGDVLWRRNSSSEVEEINKLLATRNQLRQKWLTESSRTKDS